MKLLQRHNVGKITFRCYLRLRPLPGLVDEHETEEVLALVRQVVGHDGGLAHAHLGVVVFTILASGDTLNMIW